jgi:hypothetical protein
MNILLKYFNDYKWIVIGSFFSAFTVILVKWYSVNNKILYLLFALLSEAILIFSYINVIKHFKILIGFVLIKLFSIITLTIYQIYMDKNITYKKTLGILCASAAIYLLQ